MRRMVDAGHGGSMNPVLITIAACEIGFWAFVVGGLALRYLARRPRASTIVLACVPLIDLVLLIAVIVDLARGGDVEFAHRLAPIYLGGTLMFGHRMIAWADVRFAHRFADGPAPVPIPSTGPVRARHEWSDFGRWLGAVAIAAVITAALGYTVADSTQREAMFGSFGMLGTITVIWLLTGPVWYSFKDQAA
jgi:hypothetical protein